MQAKPDWNAAALVDAAWLQRSLHHPALKVLDATYYLPNVPRNARAEYEAGHIPGAVFLDYPRLSLAGSPLANTMPDASQFAQVMGSLGVGNEDMVVVYDQQGLSSAPRLWWMLRAFGHHRVAVLDGGLPAWKRAMGEIETGMRDPSPVAFAAHGPDQSCCGVDEVLAALDTAGQIVDARSSARFTGETPEPRPGLRSGHIPGSRNLPYESLVGEDGCMLDKEGLARRFAEAGVDLGKPLVCSCGSGVSACVLALALHELGHDGARVYDGSWSEWGARHDLPLEQGRPA